MKNLVILFSLLGIFSKVTSQVKAKDIILTNVNDSIKKNAPVIKNLEEIFFEVTDIDRAYLNIHKIFTVMDVGGEGALMFNEYSNKVMSLEDVEIKVFDKSGGQTAKYKMRDMTTVAVGEGLIEEGKVTYFRIPASSYPVTVELNYQTKYKGSLYYPAYEIQSSGEAVVNSTFSIKVPVDIDIRYKSRNIDLQPEIVNDPKYKFYKWSVKNLPAPEFEEGTASYQFKYPRVLIAPNTFKIHDTKGDMTDWKSFGFWEYNLTKELYDLPATRVDFFKNMVKDVKTDKEKIKLIYEYLQQNFRYVSIQLGIGGYKPFAASFTDQKKYGDCKGLSFYTHAVLKSLGIKSHIALINAGYNSQPVDPSFPCNQFNHMIVCVPMEKDSIWLECTSRTNDFGVLGSFTENKNALLITEQGGVLVKTPESNAADNIFNSKTTVELSEDGSGIANMVIDLKGEYKQDFLHYAKDEKKDDQKEYLVNGLSFKQPDEFTVNYKDADGKCVGMVKASIEKIPDFSSGSKLFLPKHLFRVGKRSLPQAEKRKMDFYFNNPFDKTDTTAYILPAGYKPDILPQSKNISCQYVNYNTQYWFNEQEHALYTVARVILKKHRIPAADYAAVKNCFDEITKDETQTIVVKNN